MAPSNVRCRKFSAIDVWMTLAAIASALLLLFAAAESQAQTFTVLHSFTRANGVPNQPYNGLAITPGGILYGTTLRGGTYENGTAFELKRAGSGWLLNVLHNFQGGTDGAMPVATVTIGPGGVLYGTTSEGGDPNCGTNGGCGTVYSLQPPAHAPFSALTSWTEKVLYAFHGGSDGRTPGYGAPAFDPNGNMYGTTEFGGDVQDCSDGCGTVYELSPTISGGWTEQILHRFDGSYYEGAVPVGGIILDGVGDLYGFTTLFHQVFFTLQPQWQYYFVDQLLNDTGCDVSSSLLLDPNTFNFYGVAQGCGSGGEYGGGSVFDWFYGFSLVHDFGTTRGNYVTPEGPLIKDAGGNLYGVSFNGGAHQSGAVYKLTPMPGGWSYTGLYDFTGGDDGSGPVGNLVMDAAGNLYGVTAYGGPYSGGVVFEITP